MTDKDPKDMTVSEQLRWAANGEPYNGIDENIWTYPTGKIRALVEAVTGEWPSDNEIFSIVADKIDAELAQARRSGLERAAKSWAKANGWPGFKPGEDFGAWLDRCVIRIPCFEDGEPLTPGDSFIQKYTGECTCKGFSVAVFSNESVGNAVWHPGERVKRPAPEVLGADGLPIVVGETVWDVESGIEGVVDNFQCIYGQSVTANIKCPDDGEFYNFNVDRLTHTPPDTQERIEADAGKAPCEYFGRKADQCFGCHAHRHDTCDEAMILDLLRRQRELDARKGGAE